MQFIMKKYILFFYVCDNKSTTCMYWNCKFKFRIGIILKYRDMFSPLTFRISICKKSMSTYKTIMYLML